MTAKIIDLGLAKPAPAGAAISTPRSFAGTGKFASPEQFAGIGADVRPVPHSLGIVLWEMLTDQTPFQVSPAEDPWRRFQSPAELLKVMPTLRDAIDGGLTS